MPNLVRLGAPSDHGGTVFRVSGVVISNGIEIAVHGDIHRCPRKGHGDTALVGTSSTTSRGKKIIRVGDRAACGAVITSGDPKVNAVV